MSGSTPVGAARAVAARRRRSASQITNFEPRLSPNALPGIYPSVPTAAASTSEAPLWSPG